MITVPSDVLQTTLTPLAQHLDDNFLPIPGSDLSPADFHISNNGWSVRLRDGAQCLIAPRDDLAVCYINRVMQRYCDPYTREVGGYDATVQQWYEALCRRDAIGSRTDVSKWAQHSAEHGGNAAELGTVIFPDDQIAVSNFTSLALGQHWINDVLAETGLKAKLYGIDSMEDTDLGYGWAAVNPDGQQISDEFDTLSWAALNGHYVLIHDVNVAEYCPWWLLHVEGTAVCLPLNRKEANLAIKKENGRVVLRSIQKEIAVLENQTRDEQHRNQYFLSTFGQQQ